MKKQNLNLEIIYEKDSSLQQKIRMENIKKN